MSSQEQMSFWDHLDELRSVIIHSLIAVFVAALAVFCFKGPLFDGIIFAPLKGDFPTYRLLGVDFSLSLINVELVSQFMVHMRLSFAFGLVLAFPYVIYQIWSFVAPALYDNEKKAVKAVFGLSSLLFYLGVAVGYFIVMPLCLNFFAEYSVSEIIENRITLDSYISMFFSTVFLVGLVFEFPLVLAALSRVGIISRETLAQYRKHAVVVAFVVSGFITPADPFSLFVLAIPLYLLFEFSLLLCRSSQSENA